MRDKGYYNVKYGLRALSDRDGAMRFSDERRAGWSGSLPFARFAPLEECDVEQRSWRMRNLLLPIGRIYKSGRLIPYFL